MQSLDTTIMILDIMEHFQRIMYKDVRTTILCNVPAQDTGYPFWWYKTQGVIKVLRSNNESHRSTYYSVHSSFLLHITNPW